ncbi:uncharacterized protein LOC125052687 isoform X1 [Pieris napi]|uniref:uncharacterized protein LOC125052687 isoform X1 n=2 Tax=Pieris napi TaxID=78633 RepID=UPI001FBBDBFB|nr:uncharacterized protein LOC125052687 isoform X1 [Pieris napi]
MADEKYIIVTGFPGRITGSAIVRKLSWIVRGHFEIVAMQPAPKGLKKCFIKLSPRLNLQNVIKKINDASFGHYKLLVTPCNEPIPEQKRKKPRVLPDLLRKKMQIPIELSPKEVIINVHNEMVRELEYKYTGLFNLSKKTDHKLMENLCIVIAERLKKVASSFKRMDSPFHLSLAYRKAYPHFGDFQLLLATLHGIEDAEALPRSQINEKELMSTVNQQFLIGNVPIEKAQETCRKYSARIVKKVVEHINKLKTEVEDPENPEVGVAKAKVRQQLKRLEQFLPDIVNEVVNKHFLPKLPMYQKVRIYGEPYMPNRAITEPLFKSFFIKRFARSEKMFNMLSCVVPRQNYNKLLAKDNISLADCKLVIRGEDIEKYSIPEEIKQDLAQSLDQGGADVEMVETWEKW